MATATPGSAKANGREPKIDVGQVREYYRGKNQCTIDLLFDWFGISCMTIDNCSFYLQNRLIQTSQTGGQRYSDTSPLSIPGQVFNFRLGCFDYV
jgi:hypothetical protein